LGIRRAAARGLPDRRAVSRPPASGPAVRVLAVGLRAGGLRPALGGRLSCVAESAKS